MSDIKNSCLNNITLSSTLNSICKSVTRDYLDSIDIDNPPSPDEIEVELVNLTREAINLENQIRSKCDKLKAPIKLKASQIGDILLKLHNIVCIDYLDKGVYGDGCVLAVYQDSGPQEGLYSCCENYIEKMVEEYDYSITEKELNDVMKHLKRNARIVLRNVDPDLIAVNNGIFNFKTKQLMPFSPEYIFVAKLKVDYNPFAVNKTIHNEEDGTDWDVESWMSELSDDPEIVQLLWEVIAAIVRPFVKWNKVAWFYSDTGNNGKGTICELLRNICGDGSYASIPVADFEKPFALEPLLSVNVVITDENNVGDYVDKAANFKAAVTNDIISINRKYRQVVSVCFKGFILECCNDMIRIKDRSESFARRMLIIPFDKCFTGKERKYIKHDYLHRPEVLEYVLYKVLHMNFYELSEPRACISLLEDYKEFNDPIRLFWNEISEELVWDLVPYAFLYDLYKAWFKKNSPGGAIQSKRPFKDSIKSIIRTCSNWICYDKKVRPAQRMKKTEMLISEYELEDWRCWDSGGHYKTILKSSYNGGLIRTGMGMDDVTFEDA